jgi:SPP1 gp7 family putative phage head morphogenesis protein
MSCCDKLIFNKALRADPTQTTTLREAWASEMGRRYNALASKIHDAIVVKDVFGWRSGGLSRVFNEKAPGGHTDQRTGDPGNKALRANVDSGLAPGAFAFERSSDKAAGFIEWLNKEIDAGVLQYAEGPGLGDRQVAGHQFWTNTYIQSGYKKGMQKADSEMRKGGLAPYEGKLDIDAAFNTPMHADRVGLLYTRTFETLKGAAGRLESKLQQVLTEELALGMAEGRSPLEVARRLKKVVGLERSYAKTLARTEMIRAHHVANINTYREAGLEGVKVKAEWAAAGFNVCPDCADLEGRVFKLDEIEGLIPLHPNCRCVALPFQVGDKSQGYRPGTIGEQYIISPTQARSLKVRGVAEKIDQSKWLAAELSSEIMHSYGTGFSNSVTGATGKILPGRQAYAVRAANTVPGRKALEAAQKKYANATLIPDDELSLIHAFDDALAKLPTEQHVYYRGVSGFSDEMVEKLATGKLKPGASFVDEGFGAWNTDKTVASVFEDTIVKMEDILPRTSKWKPPGQAGHYDWFHTQLGQRYEVVSFKKGVGGAPNILEVKHVRQTGYAPKQGLFEKAVQGKFPKPTRQFKPGKLKVPEAGDDAAKIAAEKAKQEAALAKKKAEADAKWKAFEEKQLAELKAKEDAIKAKIAKAKKDQEYAEKLAAIKAKDAAAKAEAEALAAKKKKDEFLKKMAEGKKKAAVAKMAQKKAEAAAKAAQAQKAAAEQAQKAAAAAAKKALADKAKAEAAAKAAQKVAEPSVKKLIDTEYGMKGAKAFGDTLRKSQKQGLGGSTGAFNCFDAKDNKWVLKAYNGNNDQVRNEFIANRLYAAAGVPVPQGRLALFNGRLHYATRWAESEGTLGKTMRNAAHHAAAAQKHARKGFVTDAWLANWDTVGQDFDNMLVRVTESGKARVIRIDHGGALKYRAQGTPKGPNFGNTVGELESLRDASVNYSSAEVFKDVTNQEIIDQIYELRRIMKPELIDAIIADSGMASWDANDLAKVIWSRLDDLGQQRKAMMAARKGGKGAAKLSGKASADINEVRRLTKDYWSHVSYDRKSVVQSFSGSSYSYINAEAMQASRGGAVTKQIQRMDEALAGSPRYKNWIQRGTNVDSATWNSYMRGFRDKGWNYQKWDAYSSCSIKSSTADSFGTGFSWFVNDGNHAGSFIKDISSHGSEWEYLMGRNVKFRVTEVHILQPQGTHKGRMFFVMDEQPIKAGHAPKVKEYNDLTKYQNEKSKWSSKVDDAGINKVRRTGTY